MKKNKFKQPLSSALNNQDSTNLVDDLKHKNDYFDSKKSYYFILIIAFLGILPYFQTLWFDFTLDDGIYTKLNTATSEGIKRFRDFFGYGSLRFVDNVALNSGSYRPVTLLSFAIEKNIVGSFKPSVGHGINLFLYFLTIILFGFILKLVFNQQRSLPKFLYFLILVVFALHPLHVEVVASIKSRDSLLASTFGMAAIYYWLRNFEKINLIGYIFVVVLYFLALFSKEEAITFVGLGALLAFYVYPVNLYEIFRKSVPFGGVVVLYMLARAVVLDSGTDKYNNILNSLMYAAEGSDKLATNFYFYLYYIRFILFPFNFSWDYSYGEFEIVSLSNPIVLLSIVFFITLLIFSFRHFHKKNIAVFGILFYLISFSVYTNLLPGGVIGANIAHRFMFIPLLGASVLIIYGIYKLTQRIDHNNRILIGVVAGIALVLGYASYTYTSHWKNNLTISEYSSKTAPQSFRVHLTYGIALKDLGIETKDNSHFKKAIEELTITENIIKKANTFNESTPLSLAECYIHLGDTLSAIKKMREVPAQYLTPIAKFFLGKLLFKKYQFTESFAYLEQVEPSTINKGFQTEHLEILTKTGAFLLSQNKIQEAKAVFTKTNAFYPGHYKILSNLAFIAFQHEKNISDSIKFYEGSLLAIDKTNADLFNAYANLGSIYVINKQPDKAIHAFENALKYGFSKGIVGNLYLLFQAKGNITKANQMLNLYSKTP